MVRTAILSWTIVSVVLGLMVSLQYHDVVLGGAALWSASPDVAEVAARLSAVSTYNKTLSDEVRSVSHELISLQNKTLSRGGASAALERQLFAAKILAGTTALDGRGVVITIDDGKMNGKERAQFITHDWDLRSVVNELFLAGADAVSVNGVRITAQTGVFCIGPVVRVGTARLSPPFAIRAIGDPVVLRAALAIPGGVLDGLRGANRGLYVSEPMQEAEVQIPATTSPLLAQGGSGS